ncbi:MAG: alginate O-acetyltransferase complex protein AlgJ [Kiritimatiellia bacterium]|jgi:alginate O-acetyltransferase complex protein AlgJ
MTPIAPCGKPLARHALFELIVFGGFCLLPMILQISRLDRLIPSMELRSLATFPLRPEKMADVQESLIELDAYLEDHFGGRPMWIRLNSRLYKAVQDSASDAVVVGADGWLFLGETNQVLDRYRGIRRFQPVQLEVWRAEWVHRKTWLEDRDIPLYLAIIPDKHSIYGQHLPARYDQKGRVPTDALVAFMGDQFPILDLRIIMNLYAEKGGLPLYQKLDTHWTDWGSFLAYEEMMKWLRVDFPAIKIIQASELDTPVGAMPSGGLGRMLGLNMTRENFAQLEMHTTRILSSRGESYRVDGIHTRSGATRAPRLLILCDSFVNGYMAQFISESFSEVYYYHHGGMTFDKAIIEEVQPDLVLYAVVERLIPFTLPPMCPPE